MVDVKKQCQAAAYKMPFLEAWQCGNEASENVGGIRVCWKHKARGFMPWAPGIQIGDEIILCGTSRYNGTYVITEVSCGETG
jgi:hypothetical protein